MSVLLRRAPCRLWQSWVWVNGHQGQAQGLVVCTWQREVVWRDTLLHNLRTGEILPPARTNEQEVELIRKEPPPVRMVGAPAEDG